LNPNSDKDLYTKYITYFGNRAVVLTMPMPAMIPANQLLLLITDKNGNFLLLWRH